jgi:hypothetical protein
MVLGMSVLLSFIFTIIFHSRTGGLDFDNGCAASGVKVRLAVDNQGKSMDFRTYRGNRGLSPRVSFDLPRQVTYILYANLMNGVAGVLGGRTDE